MSHFKIDGSIQTLLHVYLSKRVAVFKESYRAFAGQVRHRVCILVWKNFTQVCGLPHVSTVVLMILLSPQCPYSCHFCYWGGG